MRHGYAKMVVCAFVLIGLAACTGEGGFAGLDVASFGHQKEWIRFYLNRREELRLDAVQIEALKTVRDRYRREVAPKEAEARLAYAGLADMLEEDAIDLNAAEEKVRRISAVAAEIGIKYIRAVAEAKQQLRPDQRKTARELMEP